MKWTFTLVLFFTTKILIAQVIEIEQFATGFTNPVDIANAGDSRLFVVQQSGAIRILNADGTINPTNFLNLSTAISSGGERGLLGLAFHPNYAANGYFYVNYTRVGDGATVIARFSVSANPNVADAASGNILMTIAQPFSNHNGGTLKFGPDGYLYIGTGDGGSGGDPGNRAQNINDNLGKMLRIDVDGTLPYEIPPGNPFVDVAGNDEIWAVGLRNPWKFSFDSVTGDLWIADVGQSELEEINFVGSSEAGLNYGWRCYEGNNVYVACATPGVIYEFPFAQYSHTGGACSITGGYVYNGSTYPNFANKYFFADYCVNRIGTVDTNTAAIAYSSTFSGTNFFTTFGEDNNGELYVAGSSTGTVYKIIDSSLGVADFTGPSSSIYPNPASSEFVIDSPQMTFPVRMNIYDLTGKLLQNSILAANLEAVSTSNLQSGLYIVNLTDSAGIAHAVKLAIK